MVGTKRLHDTTLELERDGSRRRQHVQQEADPTSTARPESCNIQKSPWSLFSDYWEWLSPKGDELWCTSGRINERWQSGYDDRRRPYIVQRWPENWVEINPEDAKARGIENGDYVMAFSERVPSMKETGPGRRRR